MDDIGIDLHKTSSQVCMLTEDGEPVERRIKTDRESSPNRQVQPLGSGLTCGLQVIVSRRFGLVEHLLHL